MKDLFEEREERAKLWETHPGRIYLDDIPLNTAIAAYNHTSMWPETRGADAQRDYAAFVHKIHEYINEKAKTPEQKAAAPEIFEDFRSRYKKLYLAYLHSHSNLASAFIVGGSNFPTRKMEKRNRWTDNHLQRLIEFSKKTKSVISKKLSRAMTPEDRITIADQETKERLLVKVVSTADILDKIKNDPEHSFYDPRAFRSSCQQMIERAHANGHTEAVKAALERAKAEGEKAGIPVFAKNNRVWKLADTPAPVPAETEHKEYEAAGITVEENPADNRIRLIFDGKPPAEIRQLLKSNGFRWSPRFGAWQRQLTANGRYAAERVIKELEKAA